VPTECELSPTLAFAHGHAILSSTEDGARRVAAALTRRPDRVAGDLVRLRGAAIADYLQRNRGVLALGRVLDTGASVRRARQDVDAIAAIVGALDWLEVTVAAAGSDRTEVRALLRREGRR
jgi:hypothetical protein